jgi:hypothetical protein
MSVQASYPSPSSQLLLIPRALPLGRHKHAFASFREFVKTRDFGCGRYCRGGVMSGLSETFCPGAGHGTYLAL